MARLHAVRFLSVVRASGGTLLASLRPPPRPIPRKCDAHQNNKRKDERASKTKESGQRKPASSPPTPFLRTPSSPAREGTLVVPPPRLFGLRTPLLQRLLHLQLRHRTHVILLPGRHPPTHLCGGEQVQHRPAAPLNRQEVSDRPPILLPPSFPPYPRPHRLLGLPLQAHLDEMLPSLGRIPAPPALRGGPVLSPVEILAR